MLLSGGKAEGVVVDHARREIDESVGFHPVVTFLDHEQKRHHFTSSAGWGSAVPKVGTKVRVRYLRADPALAYIQSFLHLWAGPAAMFALAIGALAVATKV